MNIKYILLKKERILSLYPPMMFSALLFTGHCCQTVSAGLCLAFVRAGLALGKLRVAGDQRAAPATGIAAGILPALVTYLVQGGADLR
jgi:hypothetical protein